MYMIFFICPLHIHTCVCVCKNTNISR